MAVAPAPDKPRPGARGFADAGVTPSPDSDEGAFGVLRGKPGSCSPACPWRRSSATHTVTAY